MAQNFGLAQAQGSATANNGATSATVIAAQTGKTLRITHVTIAISVAGTGGGSLVTIRDGTTNLISFASDAVGNVNFNWGEIGYALTSGNALTVLVSGAITLQSTATVVALAIVA